MINKDKGCTCELLNPVVIYAVLFGFVVGYIAKTVEKMLW